MNFQWVLLPSYNNLLISFSLASDSMA